MNTTRINNSFANQSQKHNLLADLAALSHIFNGIGSACAVGIGYLATAGYEHIPVNILVFVFVVLATLFISNGGFIINDILDLQIDRINRPDRPLAAGRVPVWLAWTLYAAYTLIGIMLSFLVSPAVGTTALAIAVGLALYSAVLKKRFVVGHLLIAALGAILFPFGGLAAGFLIPALYSAPVSFLAFFAREVLKTIPDAEGDRANNVANFTTRYGEKLATRIVQVSLAVCGLALPLVRIVWPLNVWYLVAIFAVIWPLVGFFVVTLSRQPDPDHKNVNSVLRLSKLMFLLVALAILVGSFQT